jgi:hypothetical protein
MHPLQCYIDTALAYTNNYQKLLKDMVSKPSPKIVSLQSSWKNVWQSDIAVLTERSFATLFASI